MTATPEERAAAITEILEEAFRATDRAAYNRGLEDVTRIVENQGTFWRLPGWGAVSYKIRELKRTSDS